ncbi:MAG: SIR2 family protein [Candidatus Hydrogenedentes bacterium]|nr:SIR2 family protein [Candidatus Hydrogenedentota bacterium]
MFNKEQAAYKALRDIVVERTNRFVCWLGAGFSVDAGLPTWSQLRDRLCATLQDKANDQQDDRERSRMAAAVAHAQSEQDLWLAFTILRNSLGQSTFTQQIRGELDSNHLSIPEKYRLVWQLPVSGILTLNLDRFAVRSYASVRPGAAISEFDAKEVESYSHLLKSASPFVANLHGRIENVTSWVLTRDDLSQLTSSESYKTFIDAVFLSRTVVFMGITATDFSIGSHLDRLKDLNIDHGMHFWITDNRSPEAAKWAEKVGLQCIYYTPTATSHNELAEILEDLKVYVSIDVTAEPVPPPIIRMGDPNVQGTQTNSPAEGIRRTLNEEAREILARDGDRDRLYREFLEEREEEIHKAWFISTRENKNSLLGYRVLEMIGEGAFAQVFKALADDGSEVAIKVMHQRILRNRPMLESFRRGVRSMKILSKYSADGMVPYINAAEIPALAVMKLVDGPNLRQAMEAGIVCDWTTRLRIAHELTAIIHRAHSLPERVLHRDLRPENVMLEGGWTSDWRVVVLDFDLSWHLGATEMSFVSGDTSQGFLAPEQTDHSLKVSTRNAAVDSFGIGMLLFYLLSRRPPKFNEHRTRDWHKQLWDFALRHKHTGWQSIPVRFCRLIEKTALDDPNERIDVAVMEGELSHLQESDLNPRAVRSAEMLADELSARLFFSRLNSFNYAWDQDKVSSTMNYPSGMQVSIIGKESLKRIEIEFQWMNTGERKYSSFKKHIMANYTSAIQVLQKGGFQNLANPQLRAGSIHFAVAAETSNLARNIDSASAGLIKAAELVSSERF